MAGQDGGMHPEQLPVRVVTAGDLQDADPTPGMHRQQAFAAPGATSGWHHHGEHETSLYVVKGRMRLEFGPGGREAVEAGPGDFVHVPAFTVHRESNPGQDVSLAVIARAGTGVPTVNVERPLPERTEPGIGWPS